MDVYIDAARRDDLSFAGDRFRPRSDDNIYIRLYIRISCLADRRNMTIFNADICFYDSPVVENQRVVMTVSTAPSVRERCDWPMPSRMTFPPPNFSSSP